jgi:hypothetical protein
MAWEDLFWEIHTYVDSQGKKKQFNEELNKIKNDPRWEYSDTREQWSEAFNRIKDD